ncbi:uncharacterized protein UTRI_04994 [Ustilago trichophora]|uniref:Uncharacterized protein n=1 Tax=Ustilago trichophora TaxID=86804 RepID=A0A5C3EDY6_9BASI|nr:uncharacterized protein UTRI_04994 [Ustilago trichophora]
MKVTFLSLFSFVLGFAATAHGLGKYENYCGKVGNPDLGPRACFRLPSADNPIRGISATFDITKSDENIDKFVVLPPTAFETSGWQGEVTRDSKNRDCVNVHLFGDYNGPKKEPRDFQTCIGDGIVINVW